MLCNVSQFVIFREKKMLHSSQYIKKCVTHEVSQSADLHITSSYNHVITVISLYSDHSLLDCHIMKLIYMLIC